VNILEKPTTHRKKHFVSNAFKYMIAVSSIAGTLGIWNLLANKDLVNANAQNNTSGQTTTNTDQAPLPTLVPVIKVDLGALKANTSVITVAQPTTESVLREVAKPTAAPSTNNNVDQGAPAVLPPAPVTTTQSSK
jgi:hypothetical protein